MVGGSGWRCSWRSCVWRPVGVDSSPGVEATRHDSDRLVLMARSIALGLALGGLVACRPSTRDFLETIKPQVVALLCDRDRPPDQLPIYYRKCFEVDEVQCIAAMQRD